MAAFGLLLPAFILIVPGRLAEWHLNNVPAQVVRVLLFVIAVLSVYLSVNVLNLPDRFSGRAWDIYGGVFNMLLWAGIPALLLLCRVWIWPAPASDIAGRRTIPAAVLLLLAFGFVALARDYPRMPGAAPLALVMTLFETLLGALGEEVVFRVMLLTYLAHHLKSRILALVLSSLLFGFGHVAGTVDFTNPLTVWLSQGLVLGLATGVLGMALGAAWLKTRSLPLIVVAHAMANLGPALTTASQLWS
jgi:membrane protease YdiL (CAAX protease family)